MREPAVVNVDVGVAHVFVAVADNEIGHLFEKPLTDAIVRVIEAVKTHLTSWTQSKQNIRCSKGDLGYFQLNCPKTHLWGEILRYTSVK